jgi:hypothetical protein
VLTCVILSPRRPIWQRCCPSRAVRLLGGLILFREDHLKKSKERLQWRGIVAELIRVHSTIVKNGDTTPLAMTSVLHLCWPETRHALEACESS